MYDMRNNSYFSWVPCLLCWYKGWFNVQRHQLHIHNFWILSLYSWTFSKIGEEMGYLCSMQASLLCVFCVLGLEPSVHKFMHQVAFKNIELLWALGGRRCNLPKCFSWEFDEHMEVTFKLLLGSTKDWEYEMTQVYGFKQAIFGFVFTSSKLCVEI